MKKKIKRQSPKTKKITKSSSLLTYIVVVFIATLTLCLISFSFFWNSSARNLSVEIQRATQEEIENPFIDPIDESIINFEDGILKPAEVDRLLDQIDELAKNLNPNSDFKLTDETDLLKLLEF